MTYIIFTLLHNLLDFRQVNLFKTAKHWDSFFTHCITQEKAAQCEQAGGRNRIMGKLIHITFLLSLVHGAHYWF